MYVCKNILIALDKRLIIFIQPDMGIETIRLKISDHRLIFLVWKFLLYFSMSEECCHYKEIILLLLTHLENNDGP